MTEVILFCIYTDILQCEMFPLSLRNHLELRTMILLPFEEFEAWVQDIADSRSPELRMGSSFTIWCICLFLNKLNCLESKSGAEDLAVRFEV